ncbi:MAG TPA: helix-turn-helix transcriptional regulator [Tepidisphaeraceae bacterium]|jgi:DNA-binding phage protein
MAIITQHPLVTPARIAELIEVAKKIDREEKDQIIAKGRAVFARHERIKATIARLKAARQAQQMTLEQVAAKSGIGKANLSRLENDQDPNPTIDTLLRVADAVGYDLLPTS